MSADARPLWDVWHIRLLDADLEVVHEIHVTPYADLIQHEHSRGCVCRPDPDPERPRIFKHVSLDGRELCEEATDGEA